MWSEEFGVEMEVFDNLMTPAERKIFLDYAGVKGDKVKAADEFIQKNFTEKLSKEDVTNFSKEEKLRLEKFLDRIYEYIQNIIKKITGVGSKITKADIVDAIKASAMRLRENAAKAKAEAEKKNAQIGKPKSQKEIIDEHISKFPTKEQLEGMTKEQIIKTLWGEPYKALCSLYRLPFGDNNNLFYDGYSFGPKLTKGYRKDDAITYSRAYMEEIKKREV